LDEIFSRGTVCFPGLAQEPGLEVDGAIEQFQAAQTAKPHRNMVRFLSKGIDHTFSQYLLMCVLDSFLCFSKYEGLKNVRCTDT
jgi:hypothetical protein